MTVPTETNLEAALDLVERGFFVFPLDESKRPYKGTNGVLDATDNPLTIMDMWHEHPEAWPACDPGRSGHFVLDVDDKGDKRGSWTLQSLIDELGGRVAPEPFMITQTPSGGYHWWFEQPHDRRIGNTVQRIGPGLDTRGNRGYVVMPCPGNAYQERHYDAHNPAPAPAWLIERAFALRDKREAIADLPDDPRYKDLFKRFLLAHEPVAEGGGADMATFNAIARGRDWGIGKDTNIELMMEMFPMSPKDRDYIELKAENVYKYAQNEAGADVIPPPEVLYGDLGILAVPVPEERQIKFKLMTETEQRAMTPPEWNVVNWIPRKGTTLIYGSYGSYKSFIGLELGMCTATGVPFYQNAVKHPGPVIFCAGEGAHGVGTQRAPAWREARGDYPGDFYLTPHVPHANPEACQQFIQDVLAQNVRPVMVLLDTAARMMVGLDENNQKDASYFVEACSTISRALDCQVVAIHHAGKNIENGSRGSTAIPAGFDTVIALEKIEELYVEMKIDRQKDFEPAKPIRLRGGKVLEGVVFEPSDARPGSAQYHESGIEKETIACLMRLQDGETITTATLAEMVRSELNWDENSLQPITTELNDLAREKLSSWCRLSRTRRVWMKAPALSLD